MLAARLTVARSFGGQVPTEQQKLLSDVPPATSGLLTTEFWKSFIYAGISIATGLGIIGPSVPDKYKTVIDSAAFLAGAICIVGYTLSRGKTKAAAVEATAKVLTTKLETQSAEAQQQAFINSPAGQAVNAGQQEPLP